MNAASLLSLASGAGSVFGGLKIAAVLIAVVGASGSLAYCTHSLTSGAAAKAEADRLADIAQQNAETNEKLRKDTASARAAEKRYRAASMAAEARAREAIAARKAREREGKVTKVCTPGCVISR